MDPEPDERRRRSQYRDEGRGAGERPPLGGERLVEVTESMFLRRSPSDRDQEVSVVFRVKPLPVSPPRGRAARAATTGPGTPRSCSTSRSASRAPALTQVSLPCSSRPPAVAAAVAVARLPVGAWRYRHERAWSFSTQSPPGWAADRAKSLAIEAVLTLAALAPLFARPHVAARAGPGRSPGAALLVFLLGFLAPVVLEPVFNRFRPLEDDALGRRLHALAVEAGAPLRRSWSPTPSRRTTKPNAYVSGIGGTRRLVLWDTLLASPADEIAVVLAHELGHRVRRHVRVLTAAAMAGAAAFVVRSGSPAAPGAERHGLVPLLAIAELAALPALSALRAGSNAPPTASPST